MIRPDERMPDGTLSDGCTFFPEGYWHDCCVAHDYAYRQAFGTWMGRRRADLALYRCVKAKGYPFEALLIFLGVRAGGWLIWWKRRLFRKGADNG